MSPCYPFLKIQYDNGVISKERLKSSVPKWITAEEYQIITGEEYA